MDLAGRLAEALGRLRQEAGLTQVEMARRLGISQPTLARLEKADQNVTLKTLTRLCTALRCEPGNLFAPAETARLAPRLGTRRQQRGRKKT